MAKVMSPNVPAEEVAGMEEAEKFFSARPQYGKEMVLFFGEQVFTRRGKSARAVGFRRMAYIIAQTRADDSTKRKQECRNPSCGKVWEEETIRSFCPHCGCSMTRARMPYTAPF